MNRFKEHLSKLSIVFFVLTIFLGTNHAQAQKTGLLDGIQIGFGAGALHYYGDISNTSFLEKFKSETKVGFHFNLEKKIAPWFTIGGQIMTGKLVGYKNNIRLSNSEAIINKKTLVFNATVYEYHLYFKFSASPLLSDNLAEKLDIYGKVGIGFSNWSSQLSDEMENNLGSSGSSVGGIDALTNETVVPLSVGAEYFPIPQLGLGFEIAICPVNSDLMDCYDSGESGLDYYGYTSLSIVVPLNFKSRSLRSDYRKAPKRYRYRRPSQRRR